MARGEIVRMSFHGTELPLIAGDAGKPHIVLRPVIEGLGLDYSTQRAKLRSRSWAVMGQCPTTGADGKTYQMVTVSVRTFLMLLATIDEHRVAEHVRPLLVAYQSEVADAIEAYWTQGVALRPTGTEAASTPAIPRDYAAALRAAADQYERAEAAEAKVAELAPRAAAADTLCSAEGTFTLGEVGNMFGIGRTKLFGILRKEEVMQKSSRRPYQEFLDKGWFRVVGTPREVRDEQGELIRTVTDYTSYLYPEGAIKLHEYLARRGYKLVKPDIYGESLFPVELLSSADDGGGTVLPLRREDPDPWGDAPR